jgi:hypothetical protein
MAEGTMKRLSVLDRVTDAPLPGAVATECDEAGGDPVDGREPS